MDRKQDAALEPYAGLLGEKFEKGLETRRSVLGDDYVSKSISSISEFNFPIQKLTTEYCWNEIWNRPGLSHRDRSLLNLGMISALNRPHELRTHVIGALNNGISPAELTEIFLQVAVYCGMPAGLDSFRIAKSVLDEQVQSADD
ncbi:carboxymuconolactone decarboxylase family protein [Stappia indica]|uniref:carboxymuconolactone decarboxylase family protein n=1 Tax=Stappia indica TaxID=538381 RepID=UPI001CD68DAA|nr:carboxymuconolactone decarboxylase family protein [Stappia indica]MCA1300193.1 carboxymuconolactone decarboxylase family protein [Stappia indica]